MESLTVGWRSTKIVSWVVTAAGVTAFNVMFLLARGKMFWFVLPACASLLAVSSVALESIPAAQALKRAARNVPAIFVWGIGSAIVLYAIFLLGNMGTRFLTSFGGPQIQQVYNLKSGMSPLLIALLMIVFIGPAEEIFWRAFRATAPWPKFTERAASFSQSRPIRLHMHPLQILC